MYKVGSVKEGVEGDDNRRGSGIADFVHQK